MLCYFQTVCFCPDVFFCWWKALVKLGVNQICSNFPVTNSGSRVFIKSFMTTSLYRFWVNFKPCIFIQMFFLCCWKKWLKLGVYHFYSIFSVPNSGIRVFIKFLITTSVYRFWLNFETCVLIEMFFFCCWNTFLKFGVTQLSSIFSVPSSGRGFSGYWKRFHQIFHHD